MSLTPEQIDQFTAFAHQLARVAGEAAMPHFRVPLDVVDKGKAGYDPVTVADQGAERAMRELIATRYPGHGVLGEEEASVTGSEPYTWVLDPIDGTRAFITGLPLWGTLIALNDGARPRIGVMNQPFTGERYLGTPNGAWLNGVPIATRPCADLAQARVMATSLEIFTTPALRAGFEAIAGEAQLLRMGGDCYAYCLLAQGLVDVVIEASLMPYDVQALIPIVEAAGGRMTTWDGGDAQHGGAILACGDPALHARLLERLRPYVDGQP
ncbi:histidinol-phosphatase [Stutzerimonas kirkiae]|uniref:histidinol-phosphatase n=1 Tax=Stutzerimonas kirkiae TaxID=2211392 RepID=UPI00103850EA|nr:histidinol-phosphatase [Stutzerimonas kirkiae]TBV16855.1 histidinol-phosphatase [Stutzerimonas kirkiae]